LPTPVQKQVIPCIMQERDVFVAAPTGSGKTYAYLIPIIHMLKKPNHKMGVRALIVLPTRELANQVDNEVKKLITGKPFKVCLLAKTSMKVLENTDILKYDILITTPKKLIHLITTKKKYVINHRTFSS